MRTIPVTCSKDCGAGCPLIAGIEEGRITHITDNPLKGAYMQGCPKGYHMHTALDHPDRLRYPLIRTGPRGSGRFRRADWEEALQRIAEQMRRRQNGLSGGLPSIMRIGGSGSCRSIVHNTGSLAKRFLSAVGASADRTFTDTLGNYSSEAADFMKPHLFGAGKNDFGIDPRSLLHSAAIVLLGLNPGDTRFGCRTEQVLAEVKRRGVPVIIIDPRKTRSVRLYASQWIPIRPGTDSVLLSALIYEVLTHSGISGKKTKGSENNEAHIERICSDFTLIREYVLGIADEVVKTPEWAAPICGIDPQTIRELAALMMKHCPTALLPGLSVQRSLGGEETDRLGLALQIALGNVGIVGGSAGCGQWNYGRKPRIQRIPSRVSAEPEAEAVPEPAPKPFGVPVFQWADAVLNPEAYGLPEPISMIYNVGGNFLGQSADTLRTAAALEQTDFIVSHEHMLTPTAKWSDIVLPASMFLERNDINTTNSGLVLYSGQAAEPRDTVKDDYEIFQRLSSLLGCEETFTEGRSADQWLEYLLGNSEIEDVNRFKEIGWWEYEGPDSPWIGLSYFVSDPEQHPLGTPSGKIELSSASYLEAGGSLHPLPQQLITTEDFPLAMVTPHERYRINSQYIDTPALKNLSDDDVWMHPDDAGRRGIASGDSVIIESEIGSIRAEVRITRRIMPGAVSKCQGTHADADWVRDALSGNGEAPGAGVNVLTSAIPTKPSRGSRTHSIAVEVRKA